MLAPDLQIGELVIELDPKLPRGMWRLAVLKAVHPSEGGLVRKCTIKTSTGEYVRPITQLCLLDIKEEI